MDSKKWLFSNTPAEGAVRLVMSNFLHNYHPPHNPNRRDGQVPPDRHQRILSIIDAFITKGYTPTTIQSTRMLFDTPPELELLQDIEFGFKAPTANEILKDDFMYYNLGYALDAPNMHGISYCLTILKQIFVTFLQEDLFQDPPYAFWSTQPLTDFLGIRFVPFRTCLLKSFEAALNEAFEVETARGATWPFKDDVGEFTAEALEYIVYSLLPDGSDPTTPWGLNGWVLLMWDFIGTTGQLLNIFKLQAPHTAQSLKAESNPGSILVDSAFAQLYSMYMSEHRVVGAHEGPAPNHEYSRMYDAMVYYAPEGLFADWEAQHFLGYRQENKGNVFETLAWTLYDRGAYRLLWATTWLNFHLQFENTHYPWARMVS